MKNTHDKDASRRSVTRATAIAVAAGLVFTTAQVAQAQDPAENTTTKAVETVTSTPAVTPVESITPVVSAVTPAAPAAAAGIAYPADYLTNTLEVFGINKDAKPVSSTGRVDWTAKTPASDDAGFITGPNTLASRKVEIKLSVPKGLEGFFSRYETNGKALVNIQALLPKTEAAGFDGAVDQANTDYSRVAKDNSTSQKIQESVDVKVGEEGRELKISYTTPANVGAFVSVEAPGYITEYDKDAKFDLKSEVSSDVPSAAALITSDTNSLEVKADQDYKAPENEAAQGTIKAFLNDADPKNPTGKTKEGKISEIGASTKPMLASGKDTISVVFSNESDEVALPDATVVLPNGAVAKDDQEIKPGETVVYEFSADLLNKNDVKTTEITAASGGLIRNFKASAFTSDANVVEAQQADNTADMASKYATTYGGVNRVTQGDSATLKPNITEEANAAATPSVDNIKAVNLSGQPDFVTVQNAREIVIAPQSNTTPDAYSFTYEVEYADGSKEAPVNIEFDVAEPAVTGISNFSYQQDVEVPQGERRELNPNGDFPEGTKFELVNPHSIIAQNDFDSNTGKVVIRPAADAAPGSYPVRVRASYTDANGTVVEKLAETFVTVTEKPATNTPSTTRSQADEVNDIVEEIGTVLTGVLGGLAPILGVVGAANKVSNATTSRTSAVRVTPTNSVTRTTGTRTSNSGTNSGTTNTGNRAGSRVASNASARTTNRSTTTRRAATNNSARTTRATTASRTTSSRLANTGANSWSIVAIALLLIALAGMFLMISRRNREV